MAAEPPAGGQPKSNAIALLRANAPFRRLWCARSISFVGNSLSLVALLLYVADTVGTGTAVALLMLAGDFAPTLLSPLTGTLGDRVDRARLMTLCELAQGGLIALIALAAPPLPLLLLLVGLRTTVGEIFNPASRSAVPALVADDELASANAALGFGTHGLDLIGPLLAAALLPFVGVTGLLLADAATFLVSALLLAGLPALPPAAGGAEGRGSLLKAAAEGLGYIWRHRTLRPVGIGFFAVVACTAVDDVALVFLAKGPLGGGDADASLLYAGSGAGLLVGFALLSRYGGGLPARLSLLAGFGLSSAGNLLTGLAPAVPAAFAMQAVRGLGLSLTEVGNHTLLQRLVPPHLQGRVFGNLYGAIGAAAALSYAAGGYLLDLTDPRLVLIVAGLGGLLAAALTALALPPALRQARDGGDDEP